MRTIGRALPAIQALPSARALAEAAIHQATSAAPAPGASTGIRKGVYRFASHREADEQVQVALAFVIAAEARQRGRR